MEPKMRMSNSTSRVIQYPGCGEISFYDSVSNCKLTHIDRLPNIFSWKDENNNEKELIERFKYLFLRCRIAISTNVIDERTKDYILKNFEVYSYSKVPIGYHDSYQYHFVIKNPHVTNMYQRPVEHRENIVVTQDLKYQMKDIFTTIMKKNRRKTDIIEKLLESI